jgi:hypothetical protein
VLQRQPVFTATKQHCLHIKYRLHVSTTKNAITLMKDTTKMDLKQIECGDVDWIHLAQDGIQ